MVRESVSNLLKDVADKSCEDLYFASNQANRISNKIFGKWSIKPEFPWEDKANSKHGVFRHTHNEKWFALVMNVNKKKITGENNQEFIDAINIKINLEDGNDLRSITGIYPAYHMNKKHWITIILDETIKDEYLMDLIEKSFDLTK